MFEKSSWWKWTILYRELVASGCEVDALNIHSLENGETHVNCYYIKKIYVRNLSILWDIWNNMSQP